MSLMQNQARKKENNMDPMVMRMIILVAIIVSLIDGIAFYTLKQHPEKLTLPFAIGVILITVIVLSINIWFHIIKNNTL